MKRMGKRKHVKLRACDRRWNLRETLSPMFKPKKVKKKKHEEFVDK